MMCTWMRGQSLFAEIYDEYCAKEGYDQTRLKLFNDNFDMIY